MNVGEWLVSAWLIATVALLLVALAWSMVRMAREREWVEVLVIAWALPLLIGLVLMAAAQKGAS